MSPTTWFMEGVPQLPPVELPPERALVHQRETVPAAGEDNSRCARDPVLYPIHRRLEGFFFAALLVASMGWGGNVVSASYPDSLWLGNNGLAAATPVENSDKAGNILRSFSAPATGIALDLATNRLFVASARNPIQIYDLDTLTLVGSITQSPSLLTGGDMSYDGTHLFRADPSSTSVFRVDITTGQATQFIVGLNNPIGLAWDGSHHYILEAGWFPVRPRITRYTSTGLPTGEGFDLSPVFSTSNVAGIAYDTSDGTLWLGSQSSVYHLSTTGAVLGSFPVANARIVHGLEYQPAAAIPEPRTYLMFAIGLAAVAWMRTRKKRSQHTCLAS